VTRGNVTGEPRLEALRPAYLAPIFTPCQESWGHGYAGIDNELYTEPKTGMFFADAKAGLAEIIASVKALVPT
jgi:NAD/NADP transhydrogenase beta subunit